MKRKETSFKMELGNLKGELSHTHTSPLLTDPRLWTASGPLPAASEEEPPLPLVSSFLL